MKKNLLANEIEHHHEIDYLNHFPFEVKRQIIIVE